MKIDRLIGILSILLQQERVTAPYLAEKFEVSRRTINRDIEDICKAGIPLVTTQGTGGGISIMDGYRIDRTVLTSSEMQSILTGLRSLDSVSGTNKYQQLMEKLSVGNSSVLASTDHILIDLSSWYKSSLAPKIELIQSAVDGRNYISFRYYGPNSEGERKIEPYLLVFQWSSWYVWGYCTDREDYRLFKLNRILDLKCLKEHFEKRDVPDYDMSPDKAFPICFHAVVVCDPAMRWRLIEEYGVDSFEERGDGKLLFKSGFSDKNHLFGWLLSMGDQAELTEPEPLREEFAVLTENICRIYRR